MITVSQEQLQDVLNALGLEGKTSENMYELKLQFGESYIRYRDDEDGVPVDRPIRIKLKQGYDRHEREVD